MKGLNLFRKDTRSRIVALALATVMALSGIPSIPVQAEENNTTVVATVADPETLHRPIDIYGQNTLNAGKITVGKSVDTTGFGGNTLDGVSMGNLQPDTNNFLVTLSQSAQAVGLASKLPVPIDAVFVLDTSGSMESPSNDPRYENMIDAANEAIASLLAANDQNRVAVVAFSSADYGEGTSNNAAANVLSELAHYDGEAAAAHLKRVDSEGAASSDGIYVAGRKEITTTTTEWQQVQVGTDRWGRPEYEWQNVQVSKTVNAFRRAEEGGTNIQAGIALGAEILMNVAAADTKVLVEGEQVTRMPFIIVLSDGAPTFSSTAANWYDADAIADADEQGPGSAPYAGNGFLAAMTAAYYKGKITEYYYGVNASEDNRCNIYTVGVDVNTASDMTASEVALAEMTLNPAQSFTNSNSWYNRFSSYWSSYNAANVSAFNIDVGEQYQEGRETKYRSKNFQINTASITASRNYVNGKNKDSVSMYAGGIGYNDEYFATSGSSEDLNNTFKELVRLIQIKAISLPTDTSVSADFGGYVHFYDPIGEYMEVKDVHGIVADGYFFKGASFAKNMVNYGTANADADFDAAITMALNGRLELSESGKLDEAAIKAIVDAAMQADGQLYYSDNSDYENSFCWWGSAYTDDAKDEHVQFLGFAQDDSIEYIESTTAPDDADYVCRSYYYYGTAGGTIEPIDDFLLMVIRVQRSLVAPYQETVYVSIPGSLLSVDRVLITEDHTKDPVTYESFVQAENPVRIIYEVGLQSDINAQNVAQKLAGSAYVEEKTDKTVVTDSKDNYEESEDTYYFYTNDWDRTKSGANHERALAHAGFDVAADNDFYAFLEDTLLYTDTNGTPATSLTTGETYYYKRPYYEWTNATAKNDEKTLFACTPKEIYIVVKAPSQDVIDKFATQKDGQWYVKAGTYTGYSLSAANDDTVKSENATGTSTIVAHPMRTNAEHDSHYTVYLGNNGRLALKADKTKTVQINADAAAQITDNDGNLITVGDVLTYTIKVVNNEEAIANAVVTDRVPYGTEVVESSISFDANGTGVANPTITTKTENNLVTEITWNIKNIPAGGTVYVSFQARVTPKVLGQDVITVDNTATIQIGNNPAYTTNTVENPPHGKYAQDTDGTVNPGTLRVGDELTYRINYYNNEDAVATVTITDIIPAGTTYMEGTATHSSNNSENTSEKFEETTVDSKPALKWTLTVQPNTGGYVSFKVRVNENAKTPVENGATNEIGGNSYTTNTTSADVPTGNLTLTKTVAGAGGDSDKEFELVLTSRGAENDAYVGISGTFAATRNGNAESVTFTNGIAKVKIKAKDVVVISGLPEGLRLNVTETAAAGYTPTINAGTVAISSGTMAKVDVVNSYVATPYEFQLHGTKVLETDEYFDNANFVFEVYRYKDSSQPWTGDIEFATSADATVSSTNKTAEFHFAPRTFTVADVDTHYYVIEEKIPDSKISGLTYDSTKYYLKLEVKNDGAGAIKVVSSIYSDMGTTLIACTGDADAANDIKNDTIKFVNKYDTATIQLKGTKVLKNKDLTAGQFAFEVRDGNNNVVSRGQNDAEGNVTFIPITYTQEGTYEYTIKEQNGGVSDYRYDSTTHTVKVTVSKSNENLVASVTEVNGVAITNGTYSLTFTNMFVPAATSFNLTGTKTLNNLSGDSSKALKAGQFEFEVLDANGKVVSTGTNDKYGDINFTDVVITAIEGDLAKYETGVTYKYTVKEVIPTGGAKDPYMNYATNTVDISVKVTVDKTTEKLKAEVVGNPTISFTNTQYPDSVTIQPEGLKKQTVNSQDQVLDGLSAKFSFSIVPVGSNESVTTGVGSANGNITFGTMTFTQPGTYKYWVKESNQNTVNGITYDSTKYLLVVTVTNEMTATYKFLGFSGAEGEDRNSTELYTNPIDISESSEAHYTNEYAAKTGLDITAKKVMLDHNGTTISLGAWRFAFKLQKSDSNGNIDAENAFEVDGISDKDGNITFATLNYDDSVLAGDTTSATFYYVMSEIKPVKPLAGVTYDPSQYLVQVTVSRDDSGMKAEVTSIKKMGDTSGTPLESITFSNSYQAVTGTSATITAKKELTGRPLSAGEFIFKLYYVNGSDETLVATTTNDADGKVSFTRNYLPNAIDFAGSDTKTYTYVIREEEGNLGGVDYNIGETTAFMTKVKIKNNTDVAQLEIESIEYYAYEGKYNGADINSTPILVNNSEEVVFKNHYTPYGAFTPVGLKKELKNRPLFDDEFTFEVRTNDADNELVSTGLSKKDGSIVFTPIALNNAGEFEYVITETEPFEKLAGITYTDAKYYLKIKVTDNNEGDLVVSQGDVKFYSDSSFTNEITDLTKLVFANTYTVHRITVPVKATKVLNGRDLKDNEFDFVLLDKSKSDTSAKVIARADNVAAVEPDNPDDVVFTLNYEYNEQTHGEAQTYIYYMSEVAPVDGHAGGVEIDSNEYVVKVTITHDEENAKLVSDVKYYDYNSTTDIVAEEPRTSVPAFVNTYTTTFAEVSVNAQKFLTGKQLVADEFEFVIYESDANGSTTGEPIARLNNDASGVVKVFDKKQFTTAGTYYYKVKEGTNATELKNANGKVIGTYINDPTEYIIKVDVVDDLQGKLHATTTYYKVNTEGEDNTVVAGINFTNYYNPASLTADLTLNINATKTVTSPNGFELAEGDFTFSVKDVYGNEVATGKNIAPTGTDKSVADIEFSDFTFTQPGEYRYWITENPTDKQGITIDTRSWEVHVTVSYAYDDILVENSSEVLYPAGTLYIADGAVKTYASSRALEPEAPAFVNIYNPAPVSLTITADKKLTVPECSERKLQANEFTFRVKDENGIIRAESHNDVDGNITFHFSENVVGEHTYTVVEYVPAVNANGIYYDKETKATIEVTVVDDGSGQLKIENAASITKENVAVFTNTYNPTAATTTITAKKVLHGAELTAGAFKFELVDRTQNKVVEMVTNDADGIITFTQTFDKIGQYPFLIREVKGTDANVTYDTTEYALMVDVKDNLVGQLVATVDFQREAVFENTFTSPVEPTPDPGEDDGRIYKSFAFTKVWNDNNDKLGKRPDSITVELYQDGVYVTDVILSKENGWTNTAILIYANGDHVYEWTMKEKNVPPGYVATYNQTEHIITNTLAELIIGGGTTPTGDDSNLGFFLGAAAVSLIAIIGLVVLMKFRKKDDE